MPLTLAEFIVSIPFTIGVFFAPFVIFAVWKRRPVQPLLQSYVAVTVVVIAGMLLLSFIENA